ncbi:MULTISPECIES: thioredoxin family protein [Salinicoccus]|uniref:Thioredoxin n=1 Tax=Salinicoccus roseus TaxID=45670 RepID=A0A265E638_9STAP|nr:MULTISPECIES: thioredoxin family protein [Salinicoccus]OZT77069.1 thioredoxin [Salinicoccus roseus]RPE54985.1 thioredoxin [Salinicoccus roseus]
MMKEPRTIDITSRIQSEETFVLYGYAPICANCQIAERMLDIVSEMKGFSYTSINLNYHKDLIELYEIRSAPALLLFRKGRLIREVYAFQSVTHLTEVFDEFLVDE